MDKTQQISWYTTLSNLPWQTSEGAFVLLARAAKKRMPIVRTFMKENGNGASIVLESIMDLLLLALHYPPQAGQLERSLGRTGAAALFLWHICIWSPATNPAHCSNTFHQWFKTSLQHLWIEPQNHRKAWVERNPKEHLVPTSPGRVNKFILIHKLVHGTPQTQQTKGYVEVPDSVGPG